MSQEIDMVNKPKHYIGINGLEVREVHENFVPKYEKYGAIVACDAKDAMKYVMRAPEKNEAEDIKKAIRHLQWALEGMEREAE